MPGPITINLESPFPVSLTLRDANVRDTLYVRVFRDYVKNPEKGPVTDREFRNDAAMGTEDRLVILETNTWCQNLSADQLGTQVIFEVVVADRPYNADSTVMPFFKAVTGNGRFSRSYWLAKCVSSPF